MWARTSPTAASRGMVAMGARPLHLMKAESPGPVVSKLVPKTSQSSKILYGIYCALTAPHWRSRWWR